ncbi:MAG: DUF1569 domain-containing protein [Sphingobacteriales bacterium]|nr:MAG: DUF1569 domain-containing protein [Sphingobacteriales bacterium]
MKTIYDAAARDELIKRIQKINDQSVAKWGKMTAYQMVRHCTMWEDMMQGKIIYKRSFLGKLFGKMALRNVLTKAELGKGSPTIPQFKIKGTGNIAAEKVRWIELISQHASKTDIHIQHPFFGDINKDQIGILIYKHTDHHLRQFNN